MVLLSQTSALARHSLLEIPVWSSIDFFVRSARCPKLPCAAPCAGLVRALCGDFAAIPSKSVPGRGQEAPSKSTTFGSSVAKVAILPSRVILFDRSLLLSWNAIHKYAFKQIMFLEASALDVFCVEECMLSKHMILEASAMVVFCELECHRF